MNKKRREALRIRRKKMIPGYAKNIGNAAETCRDFNVNKSSFYYWKKRYESEGSEGLRKRKP